MKKRLISGPKVRVRSTPLDEWYARLIKQEYQRIFFESKGSGQVGGLAEVKLRLFLSLLDTPVVAAPMKMVANSK